MRLHQLVVSLALGCALAGAGHAAPARSTRAPAPAAVPINGVVSQVIDGDTLLFTPTDQSPLLRVRLRDIDAPELCQEGGVAARAALADLALNKTVALRPSGRDAQGRVVATVTLADAVNLSVRMVEEGHAWSLRTRWDQGPLVRQERMATALRRGLHATGGADPPWKFRAAHGPCVDGPVKGDNGSTGDSRRR